ncbi:MAG: GDSL-type esterase/lipase family protein [Candidatus Bathyarchaeia archaeon]
MRLQSKGFAVAIAVTILVASMASYIVVTQLYGDRTIRVACVGDSITSDANYPKDLAALLGDKFEVVNFGVGRTTVSLDFEKPYMNQTLALYAHLFKPNIVIIMLGTNDAYLSEQQRSNFINDYTTLITSFQTLSSKPQIFIILSPPVFDNTIGLNASLVENEILPLIRQTAASLDLPLIDAYTPMLGHPEYFKDGVHPNDEGAKIIAEQVFNAITQ